MVPPSIYKHIYGKSSIPRNSLGLAHGYCIAYEGNIECKGHCLNGKMIGEWEFNSTIILPTINNIPSGCYDVKLIGEYKNNERFGLWFMYSNENHPHLEITRKIYHIQ